MKPVLVTGYVHPDLDGVAGAIAYGEFLRKTGKDVVVGAIGELQDEAKYLLDRFGFPYPIALENADAFDEVILVDASELEALDGKIFPEKVIEIIDHRKAHGAEQFPNAKAQIELVGAAATLVAEKFMQHSIEISRESATLVCGAILSNTLNFQGSVTTPRDRAAFAWLNAVAQLPDDFWRELFLAKSDLSGSKLAERMESDFSWFVMGDKKVGIAQIEIMGAKQLIDERGDEMLQTLTRLKRELSLDLVFQNTIELEEAKSFFVAEDSQTQQILEKVFRVPFTGIVAEQSSVIMRKQIVPLLKEEMEGRERVV